MSKLQWDNAGQRFYHNGISKVILFPTWDATNKRYTGGVAWNGVTSVEESPDGGDANDLWADNIKYGSIRTTENLKGSISAYQWPDALNELDGKIETPSGIILGQQKRNKRFGLCYRTEIGSDTNPNAGYQLHFLYDVMLSPSDKSYETVNDSPDAVEFSWDFECLPQKQTFGRSPIKYLPGEYYYDETRQSYDVRYNYNGTNSYVNGAPTIVAVASSDTAKHALKKVLAARKNNVGRIIYYINGIYTLKNYTNKVGIELGCEMVNGTSHKTSFIRLNDLSDTSVRITSNTYYRLYLPDIRNAIDQAPNNTDFYYFGNVYMYQNPRPPYDLYDIPFDDLQDLFYFTSDIGKSGDGTVQDTRTYSSVILDSRSTSAEKMTAISNMIYDGENKMPTLSDLLD